MVWRGLSDVSEEIIALCELIEEWGFDISYGYSNPNEGYIRVSHDFEPGFGYNNIWVRIIDGLLLAREFDHTPILSMPLADPSSLDKLKEVLVASGRVKNGA